MNKKIVVFGPDNSGKTTLANTLAQNLNLEYVHSPGPMAPKDMLFFVEANLMSHKDLIFDRFAIIEEMTCGKVLRGKDKFEELYDSGLADKNNLLSKVDLFIFCLPPIEKIKDWGSREQMDGIKENIDELIKSYDLVATQLKVDGYPIIKYDYTKDNLSIIEERIK